MSTAEIQRTDQEILDRAAQDDIDAIAAYNPDPDAVLHEVQDQADALFTWDYEKGVALALTNYTKKQKSPNGTPKQILTGQSKLTHRKLSTSLLRYPM